MLLIQGGLVLTPEMRFERADVVVERGKIAAVGAMRRIPKSADVIDATGRFIVPGFVEAHCHVSLFAEGIDARHYDGNEMTDPVTPHLRAIADILAEKRIPCIPGPVLFSRMKLELRGLTPRNVGSSPAQG